CRRARAREAREEAVAQGRSRGRQRAVGGDGARSCRARRWEREAPRRAAGRCGARRQRQRVHGRLPHLGRRRAGADRGVAMVEDATRRTRLANERTYLAWLRTGLTALAVAAGVGKIVPSVAHIHRWPFEVLGVAFAIVGVASAGYGAIRFTRVEQALAAGGYAPLEPGRAIVFAGAAVVLGLVTLGLIFVH